MPVLISYPSPASGGPLTGRLTDTVLGSGGVYRYYIALFYQTAAGAWTPKGSPMPAAALWSTPLMPGGNTGCAAALVTSAFQAGTGLPTIGDTVLAVATSAPNRLAFTTWPGSGATAAGKASVTPFASYGVLFFAYAVGTGWSKVGNLVPLSGTGTWTVSGVPTGRPQYAALLVPSPYNAPLPTDGTLPVTGVAATLFTTGVGVVFTSPPAAGGALQGVLTGVNDARRLTAVALTLDASNPPKITARASVACQKNGSFSFPKVTGGPSYAVAVYDMALDDYRHEAIPIAVPTVGGRVVAVTTQAST